MFNHRNINKFPAVCKSYFVMKGKQKKVSRKHALNQGYFMTA